MRSAWVKVVIATAVTVGMVPAVRADVRPVRATSRPFVVTGHERPVTEYLRAGMTPRRAALLAQLEHLAAHGADRRGMTLAAQAAEQGISIGSPGPQVFVTLVPAGDLNGGGTDVLELRVVTGPKSHTQLVAREGASGRVLWQRTEELSKGEFAFPVPVRLGPGGRPGIVVVRDSFLNNTTTLEGLDGRGRTAWRRTLHVTGYAQPAPSPVELGGWVYDVTVLTLDLDVRLHAGPAEVLATLERWEEDDRGLRPAYRGDLRYQGISQSTGHLRTIGSTVSADGWVTGGSAGDQDGDRLTDLTLAVGGSKPRLAVLRGTNATPVWSRTDVPTHGYAVLAPARAGSDESSTAPDLALLTDRDPGVVGPVNVPWVPVDPVGVTGGTVDDPTAAAHATVALLARRTGKTLWSRPGDDLYLPDTAGRSRVVVLTNQSSSSANEFVVSGALALVDRAGKVRWTRTYSQRSDRAPGQNGQAFVGGWGLADLDGDGLQEGQLLLVLLTDDGDFHQWSYLTASGNGGLLRDQTSGLLFGGLTRTGSDRVRYSVGGAGITLTALRGRDSRVLFSRLLPGSDGVQIGFAEADRLGHSACGDILFAGVGQTRSDVVVLASDGSPRWWVSGVGADLHPGQPVRPARVPTPRC